MFVQLDGRTSFIKLEFAQKFVIFWSKLRLGRSFDLELHKKLRLPVRGFADASDAFSGIFNFAFARASLICM